VAVAVVDGLEVVDVDQEQRPFERRPARGHARLQLGPIGQPGERIALHLQAQGVVAARQMAIAHALAARDAADRQRQHDADGGRAAPLRDPAPLQAVVLRLDQLLHLLHVAVVARVVARLQKLLFTRVQLERAHAVAGPRQRGAEVAQHADAGVGAARNSWCWSGRCP
jgi:hypothetical protein